MSSGETIDLTRIARELNLDAGQVARVVKLLEDGNTVPFITRYRKEQTNNLDEESIREIESRASSLKQIAERAASILKVIEGQGKLTDQLRREIESAESLKRLEDLYLPYRPKRRSRAQSARDKGLEPLADIIWNADPQALSLNSVVRTFIEELDDVDSIDDGCAGASDILAERFSENPEVRDAVRSVSEHSGRLIVKSTPKGRTDGDAFSDYFDYSESIRRIPPHRILAINRGERDGFLRVKFDIDTVSATFRIEQILKLRDHPYASFLKETGQDALTRLLIPSLDREFRREATEKAEEHAVGVFAQNLRNLLLQPPLKGTRVLAIDPGFRTGCKVTVLDELGRDQVHDLVYVTGNAEKRASNRSKLEQLMKSHDIHVIAVGNGTACRETEELLSELLDESEWEFRYAIVNEAGASIYSTSPVAREEFPDLDATARGTVSIGRRLQDPLSELVKIDPQHIGVGMYQHDVNPKRLQESLDRVIESCVNYVGVDLNTASVSLLRHISGFSQLNARRIAEWREANGPFRTRKQLLKVAGIGEATFTQAAGFLRVVGGDEPLDNTWIHPESYSTAYRLLEELNASPDTAFSSSERDSFREQLQSINRESMASELSIGIPTLSDILQSLEKPGLDPRQDLPPVSFRKGILKLEDLTEGMQLQGSILNVVDFGAFVDIGLKDSGLVHISKMANQFVRSPHEVVSVGDSVRVWVIGIDTSRRRVSLSMVPPEPAEPVHHSRPKTQDTTRSDTAKPKTAPKASSSDEAEKDKDQPMRGFDELQKSWNGQRNTGSR